MCNYEEYISPNKKHKVCFIYEGEIRFGPNFFKIVVDDQIIPKRIFGLEYKWHPESIFLALQEWLTIDYQKGPITALTLIDLEYRRIAKISVANNGFIKPIRFENNLVIFEKIYLDKSIEYEIYLNEIYNWE